MPITVQFNFLDVAAEQRGRGSEGKKEGVEILGEVG
jgi:hypothetical protein